MGWLGTWAKRRKICLSDVGKIPTGIAIDTTYNFDDHGLQGVALDGLGYVYISDTPALYKYRISDGLLIASNLTANQDGTVVEQINGLHYKDGKIYAGSMDWIAGPPYHSKIKVYDASDCSFIEEHVISDADATEGCAYGHGYWWVCFINRAYLKRYDDSWNYVDTIALPYSATFMSQGPSWDGNLLWYNNHHDSSVKVTNVVRWNADTSTFSGIAQFPHLGTGDKCSQGVCMDPDDHNYIWMAHRDIFGDGTNINRIVKVSITYNTLSNFPIMVYLSNSCGINSQDATSVFTEVGSQDKKMAFTESDGTTELYAEVEKWNYTGDPDTSEAWIWVKVPTIIEGSFIYIYYDSSHADNLARIGDNSNTVPMEAVWTENFISVHHLQEDNNDALGLINSVDHTAYNATAFLCNHDVASKVDDGKSFDQLVIKERVQVNGAHISGKDVYAVGAWFKNDDPSTHSVLISLRGTTNESDNYVWVDQANKFIRVKRGGTHGDTGNGVFTFSSWQHVYIVFISAVACKVYVNGAYKGTVTVAAQDHSDDSMNFCYFHDSYTAATYQWLGKLDEVRVIDAAVDAGWILSEYLSSSDEFIVWEDEESYVPAAPTDLTAVCSSASQVTLNWTDNAIDETAYYVERDDGGWHVISGALPPDSNSYIDNTVECDTTYLYRVRAYNNVYGTYSSYDTLGTGVLCCSSPPSITTDKVRGKPSEEWEYEYRWRHKPSEKITSRISRFNFLETTAIKSHVSRLFNETRRIVSRIGNTFSETVTVSSSIDVMFTETVQLQSPMEKRFEETFNVSSSMSSWWFEHTKIKAVTESIEENILKALKKINEIDEIEEDGDE